MLKNLYRGNNKVNKNSKLFTAVSELCEKYDIVSEDIELFGITSDEELGSDYQLVNYGPHDPLLVCIDGDVFTSPIDLGFISVINEYYDQLEVLYNELPEGLIYHSAVTDAIAGFLNWESSDSGMSFYYDDERGYHIVMEDGKIVESERA